MSGQDEAMLPCLGLPVISCHKIFSESHIINPLLFSHSGWTLALFFFCEFMDLNFISVHTCKHIQTWFLRYSIYARVTLCYVMTCSGIWIYFRSTCSIASCSPSIEFCSGFYAFIQVSSRISSFLRIRGIFTSLCDFQLVHQFLRNIVIYFLSVEPFIFTVIADLYGLQMRADYLSDYFNYVSITWNLFL